MNVRAKRELPVFALILVYFVVILAATIDLSPTSRLVPLVILVPSLILTVLRIVTLYWPDLLPGISLSLSPDADLGERDEGDEKDLNLASSATAIVWFVLFMVSIYFVGFVVSTFLFVAAFLYAFANESPAKSVLTAVALSGVVYLLFIVAINVRPLDTVLRLPVLPG